MRDTVTLSFHEPSHGCSATPALPWAWKGPLSVRDFKSPMLQP